MNENKNDLDCFKGFILDKNRKSNFLQMIH